MTQAKPRLVGLDIIKAIACLMVICDHFFLRTRYYTSIPNDFSMFLQVILKSLSALCIPLFIFVTAFLRVEAVPTKRYFFKITRVYLTYLLISVLCVLVNALYLNMPYTPQDVFNDIFGFKANTYSWYVNMFIGLFFLAPYLNILVRAMEKRTFIGFLTVLAVFSAVPATINASLPLFPAINIFHFPDWWDNLYVITFYMFGAYVAKYRPAPRRGLCLLSLSLLLFVQAGVTVAAGNACIFRDHSDIFFTLESACLFLALYDIKSGQGPLARICGFIARRSLEFYLLSYISDVVIYNVIHTHLTPPHSTQQMLFGMYFVPAVFVSFAFSLLAATVFRFLYDVIASFGKRLFVRRADIQPG